MAEEDVKKSPRTTPREEVAPQENTSPNKISPRHESKVTSPRDTQRDSGASNTHPTVSTSRESSQHNTPRDDEFVEEGSAKPPTSLISSLRQANKIIDREDSHDFVDAVIEKACRDNQALKPQAVEPTTPLGQRLHDIEADAKELKRQLSTTNPATPATTNQQPLHATALGIVSSEKEPKLMPKPSADVDDIENDLNALMGGIQESKKKKPISDKYLKMLQSSKTKPKSSSSRHRGRRTQLSTEPSRISQILNSGEDDRWADPRSSVQFKSQYEEKMFRSMQKVLVDKRAHQKSKNKQKKRRNEAKSSERHNTFERLSVAKKQDDSLFFIQNENGRKFASFDDAKNCTFMPKTNESKRKKGRDGNDSDDEAKDSRDQNFLLRQEASERKRQQEIKLQAGKKEYEALVDKKVCPVCTSVQSYDEVKEKRKNCPNCQVPYAFKTNWGNVQKSFYRRQNDAYVNGIRALEMKKQEVIANEKKSMRMYVDPSTGRVIEVEAKVLAGEDGDEELKWTRDVEDDFFTRMEESQMKKDLKMKELEDEVYGHVGKSRKSQSAGSRRGFRASDGDEFDTSQYY